MYGTLMNQMVFRAVLGHRVVTHPAEADGRDAFLARDAVLDGYKKISPDDTYLYAVPDAQAKIKGYVVGPLPGECMAALLRYEGRNYRRSRVTVQTASGPVKAIAFLGNLAQLSHSFGWRFRDPLKQEVLLRERIEKVLLEDEGARLHTEEPEARQALAELHALTIRDLIRRHFEASGISAFTIRRAIREEPLREFSDGVHDPNVKTLAPNYLRLLLKQVLFNQIEDRIHDEFRYELDRLGVSNNFYSRTISALAAMQFLNRQGDLPRLLAARMMAELPFGPTRLVEYVRWAVVAAGMVYDSTQAKYELDSITEHLGERGGGAIPLGAELEFSNIGHDVIRDPEGEKVRDGQYDGFLYFRDFALDILTWKLGGHVDDHRVKSSPQRRRGFFELAMGSLSLEANISKPITDDPWLLNRMVRTAMEFYAVAPHSLHVSLQMPTARGPSRSPSLPIGVIKCLFALGGDPVAQVSGGMQITRISRGEIIGTQRDTHMLFSYVSRRRSQEEQGGLGGNLGRWVQQFKFLRLSRQIDYEPIIMALKGLQIHYRLGTFLTASQFRSSPEARELFEELCRWGQAAQPLRGDEINAFLMGAEAGLMRERRGRPAHKLEYIRSCLDRLSRSLQEFNARARLACPEERRTP